MYAQKKYAVLLILAVLLVRGLFCQGIRGEGPEGDFPLRRVSLFSSGVGFFEHSGRGSGSVEIELPFSPDSVNDALKSLVINDPGARSPSVRYPSAETLYRTLKSLRIDLSGNPDSAEILKSLRGEEIQVYAPNLIGGRILGIEYRAGTEGNREAYLSLYTGQGIRLIRLGDLSSFAFTDPRINADLNRALDLIMGSRDADTRVLRIALPGSSSRDISLSYVIPAPVWKVSYRLDLDREEPLLQGWAIVDNDGDTDWNNVELSLVSGRPVSFIQNLYAPYRLARPVLPLSIAGAAEARTYDSGWSGGASEEAASADFDGERFESKSMAAEVPAPASARGRLERQNLAGGIQPPVRGQAAGDLFEFTLEKPVSLPRRQSAMLPLVEGTVRVEKALVFSGARAAAGGPVHPAISAELTNTTGMKLPAGPVTVFDGGTYAGDALIDFFPPEEKRLISYGDDLSVSGSMSAAGSRLISAVKVSRGLLTITRKIGYEKTYTFKNAAGETKRLILEHPITPGTSLAAPSVFEERTDSLYRFVRSLPAGREFSLTVREERPISEEIALSQLDLETFAAYVSNQEIPAPVRALLRRAIELKQEADRALRAHADLEARRTRLIGEQGRIRQNLEAAGKDSPQGQEYLRRLVSMDGEIDDLTAQAEGAHKNAQDAQRAYDDYLGSIDPENTGD
ncbi:MAG: DUF4139 domain-containing protein [Treponema sp.]|jgi:hypothetical protein|nr:DUF4139 domain-containing protein [Treponema sp.]